MQSFRPNPLAPDPLSRALEQFAFHIRHFALYRSIPPHQDKTTVGVQFKLVFLVCGRVDFEAGSRRFVMSPGDALVIPPFIRYTARCTTSEETEYGYAYFDLADSAMEGEFTSLLDCALPALYRGVLAEAELGTVCRMVHRLSPEEPGAHREAHILLDWMILQLARSLLRSGRAAHTAANDAGAQLVRQCIEHLRRVPPREFSVAELCEFTHVTQSYLYKCFQREMNCSPQKFLTLYRLKLAERELCDSSATIQELAEQFGYTSAGAFSQAFKQHFAVSPAAWRQGQRDRTHREPD